jgi:hypothetical protein
MAAAKRKSSGRKYGKAAGKSVKRAMHKRKAGTLKSGAGRHPKVKSREQAIAIGLSEARESGAKVPSKRSSSKRSTAKKGGAKKSSAKKSTRKRSTAKKSSAKKSTRKRSTAKKSSAKKSTRKRSTTKKSASKRSR